MSPIIIAAMFVAVWSSLAYRRIQPSYARYYQRGGVSSKEGERDVHFPVSSRRWHHR